MSNMFLFPNCFCVLQFLDLWWACKLPSPARPVVITFPWNRPYFLPWANWSQSVILFIFPFSLCIFSPIIISLAWQNMNRQARRLAAAPRHCLPRLPLGMPHDGGDDGDGVVWTGTCFWPSGFGQWTGRDGLLPHTCLPWREVDGQGHLAWPCAMPTYATYHYHAFDIFMVILCWLFLDYYWKRIPHMHGGMCMCGWWRWGMACTIRQHVCCCVLLAR